MLCYKNAQKKKMSVLKFGDKTERCHCLQYRERERRKPSGKRLYSCKQGYKREIRYWIYYPRHYISYKTHENIYSRGVSEYSENWPLTMSFNLDSQILLEGHCFENISVNKDRYINPKLKEWEGKI